jgi:Pyruvate/2-oxoacid:ferredoxin oxidoreductase gamma subunit
MIDFEKAVEFDDFFFNYIGRHIMHEIPLDSSKGLMQNDKSGLQYRNKRYVREKGKGIASPRQISNQTAFVNMILTGDMFRNMTVTPTDKSVEIAYNERDTNKILNALDYGYDITTLNQKNLDWVATEIAERISDNIVKQVNKDIEIKLDITI